MTTKQWAVTIDCPLTTAQLAYAVNRFNKLSKRRVMNFGYVGNRVKITLTDKKDTYADLGHLKYTLFKFISREFKK